MQEQTMQEHLRKYKNMQENTRESQNQKNART